MDDFPEKDLTEEELWYYRQALESLREDMSSGRLYHDAAQWAKQAAAARKANQQAQAPKQQPASKKPGDYLKQYFNERKGGKK